MAFVGAVLYTILGFLYAAVWIAIFVLPVALLAWLIVRLARLLGFRRLGFPRWSRIFMSIPVIVGLLVLVNLVAR